MLPLESTIFIKSFIRQLTGVISDDLKGFDRTLILSFLCEKVFPSCQVRDVTACEMFLELPVQFTKESEACTPQSAIYEVEFVLYMSYNIFAILKELLKYPCNAVVNKANTLQVLLANHQLH